MNTSPLLGTYAVKIHNTNDVIYRFRVRQHDGETPDEYYDRTDRIVRSLERNSLERFGESVVDIDPAD